MAMESKIANVIEQFIEVSEETKTAAKGMAKVLMGKYENEEDLTAALRESFGKVYDLEDIPDETTTEIIGGVQALKPKTSPAKASVPPKSGPSGASAGASKPVVTKSKAVMAPPSKTGSTKTKTKTGSDGKKAPNSYSLFVSAYARLAKMSEEEEAEAEEQYDYHNRNLPEDNKTMQNLVTEIDVEGQSMTILEFLESQNGQPLVKVVKALTDLGINRMRATGMLWNTLPDELRVAVAMRHCKSH